MVEDEVHQDPDPAGLGLAVQALELLERAEARIDGAEVRDVVPVVVPRRWKEGLEPKAIDAQPGEVVELPAEALEVADAVTVAVDEGLDGKAVDNRVLVPEVLHSARRRTPRFSRQTRLRASVRMPPRA